VVFDDRAAGLAPGRAWTRAVVVADRGGVAPGAVRFAHRSGRDALDAPVPAASAA
jgi:hypothetical protein